MFQIRSDCPTCLFVYLGVYVSPKVCQAYFKAVSLGLMLNPFSASGCKHFICLSSSVPIIVLLSVFLLYSFYDGKPCISVKIVTI